MISNHYFRSAQIFAIQTHFKLEELQKKLMVRVAIK